MPSETLVFGHFEHKIWVFVRFLPLGPPFSGISSTKSGFLCAFASKFLPDSAPASNKPHSEEKSTPVWLAIWRTWAGFANSQLRRAAFRSTYSRLPRRPGQQHLPDSSLSQCRHPLLHGTLGQQPCHGAPASNKPHLTEKSTPVWLAIWRTWAGFANSQHRDAAFATPNNICAHSSLLPHWIAAQTLANLSAHLHRLPTPPPYLRRMRLSHGRGRRYGCWMRLLPAKGASIGWQMMLLPGRGAGVG